MNDDEVAKLFQLTARCPIDTTFRVVGKKFTVLLLRNMLLLKQTRFNQFVEIEGINPKTLSARLKEMEQHGLVNRKVYPESPVRIEYRPTDKARALVPILEQMAAYSMRYYPKVVFKDGRSRSFTEILGRPTDTMK